MKIMCFSNTLYSLNNCPNPFETGFQPPTLPMAKFWLKMVPCDMGLPLQQNIKLRMCNVHVLADLDTKESDVHRFPKVFSLSQIWLAKVTLSSIVCTN